MTAAPLSVALFMLGLYVLQRAHYNYLLDAKIKEEFKLNDQKLQEFEELKKKVDALTVRAGFRG